uniref:Hydrolase n=1 Tax=Karlodinium veneficum TaxID=407301 RepID=A7YXV6_KARVE|nr:hydrolase [Karlodinium veneficum]
MVRRRSHILCLLLAWQGSHVTQGRRISHSSGTVLRTASLSSLSPTRSFPRMSESKRIHSWFDPLERWGYKIPGPSATTDRPLFAYVPGLDGSSGSPFSQFPGLGKEFELRVQEVSTEPSANSASFQNVVEDVATSLRESGRQKILLMGESYGGLVAAAVALRYPDLLSGLILVNPATAVSTMPELQEDIRWVLSGSVPDLLVPAVMLVKVGRKAFDTALLVNAVRDILIERKLEKLRATHPNLAGYYDAAIQSFSAQISESSPLTFGKADSHSWLKAMSSLIRDYKLWNCQCLLLLAPVISSSPQRQRLSASSS